MVIQVVILTTREGINLSYIFFRDHKPAAEHHYLVISKKHFGKIPTLTKDDIPMIRRMEKIGMEVILNKLGLKYAPS